MIQDSQADSKLVFALRLESDHPVLRQLNLTNAAIPSKGHSTTTPQLDDIEPVAGNGVLDAVDQKSGNIYAFHIANGERTTFFVYQPAPSTGDLPNDPAIGIVNLRTGVVTHVDTTLGSPKGLLFVPSQHSGDGGD